jgi:hypothetical protein
LEKYTEELRRLIARCCEISEAADKVAIQALRAVEREGRRRADQMRELRSRLTTLEKRVGKARTR